MGCVYPYQDARCDDAVVIVRNDKGLVFLENHLEAPDQPGLDIEIYWSFGSLVEADNDQRAGQDALLGKRIPARDAQEEVSGNLMIFESREQFGPRLVLPDHGQECYPGSQTVQIDRRIGRPTGHVDAFAGVDHRHLRAQPLRGTLQVAAIQHGFAEHQDLSIP